ncbi:MAG: hypothetical protein K0S04_205 [Herbinix sp.]|jgi:hypothetical protein|nr:hypothetical protein [Herbinix sp.]
MQHIVAVSPTAVTELLQQQAEALKFLYLAKHIKRSYFCENNHIIVL